MDTDSHSQFVAMYEANYADLLRFVARRSHPSAVDDIVGETFTIAWKRRARLPDPPRPWLFRTATNVLRNENRARDRDLRVGIRAYEPPIEPAFYSEIDRDLLAAWEGIGTKDQEVLALRYWDDLSDAEAAQVLGQTRSAYTMRLSRAKRRLAKALAALEVRQNVEVPLMQPEEGTS